MSEKYSFLQGCMVGNASEDWRHECECRAILKIRPLEARRLHLSLLEQKRGKKAADRIKADMVRIYQGRG